ncbi:MAG: hypothetical protein HKN48_06830 [Flavobacteriaceae bacterium]|nr:hypothetical protein [Flavobacteriaceae bacterium]
MKKYLFLFALIALVFSSCATRVVTTTPRTNVVVVNKAPRSHKIVVVKGKRYYYWGGRHYRKTNRGFVFVKV